ncbi:MAG: IS1380 family transposase, partial [Patescibacteria group bacterium]
NKLRIEYSDKAVTAWGGMKLMKNLVQGTGILEVLRRLPIPLPGSNRGYDPVQVIESFWVSIWIGASRFAHSGWLRYDTALGKIFGWRHVPSQSTFSRFFHRFSWKRNNAVFVPLQRWFFERLTFDNMTLDLDSSVVTRYGNQEGAKAGYNPQKPGRASHHPLMAFMAEMRMVVNAWLRPGNTGALSNAVAFLDETFSILSGKRVGLVRADSGFFGQSFLEYFETRKLHYVVAVKLFSTIRTELFRQSHWVRVKGGVDVMEWSCRLPGWSLARRMIAVRKNIDVLPKATGKLLLFDLDESRYRYSVFVTDLDLPAELVWNLYRDRADAENRIKELKADFGLKSFCLSRFFATEAAFRFIMVAYNLISLFRQFVLKTKTQATLSTLRFKCFALGAWIKEHARQQILKIALARERRGWLNGLFDITRTITPKTTFSNA